MGLDLEEEEKEVKTTTKTRTKRTKELLEENAKRMEELKTEHANMEREIEDLDKEAAALGNKDALNLKITHEKFGKGTIVKQDGKYIEVEFSDVVKKFVLPGAIADGYLKIDDENLLDYFKKRNDVHNRSLKAHLALRSNEFAMERLQDDIDKLNEKAK
ncbi:MULTISPECIES: hypothetical protein [unclassified Butyrivibrio]|uniref:hypothetical protein n=1 Tax=unclassified Butyrivibrio TaxID=2639466 RepID=UPI0003B7213A|nr:MULTISPECIES: hypothetical protein [unclassified Butyrivibrio]SEK42196.1 hypothetical protein SAMN04487770_101372 [Butyrivibrio sp. ob235]